MSNVKAILDHVIFQFHDKVHKGQFTQEKIGSIIMANKGKDHTTDGAYSRIVTVVDVGPLCKDVSIGDVVVVEKLQWTPAFKVGEESFWRTSEKFILGHVETD